MAGALPQTPNSGQSRVIAWHSGYGAEPHLQITFVFSVALWLCVKLPPRFTAEVCTAEIVICGLVTHYG